MLEMVYLNALDGVKFARINLRLNRGADDNAYFCNTYVVRSLDYLVINWVGRGSC